MACIAKPEMNEGAPKGWAAALGDVLTRDRLREYDPWVKWVRNPAAVLALATVAALLCGFCLHPRAFALAAGLSGVLAVGIGWPWLAVRGLSGTLEFGASRVREGEPIAAHLRLRNRMPWGTWGLSIAGLSAGKIGAAEATGLAHAKGRGAITSARWEAVADRRGDYPREIPRVASAFPFGLRAASRPLGVPDRLVVWPRTFPVGPIPEAACGRGGDGQSPRNRPGHSGDLLGVRPYRRGDSIRRVHWPQTARHGQLVVCELQSIATPRAQVVVDVHPDGHAGEGSDGTLEWSVRIAASFAESWIAAGAEVEVVFGREAASLRGGSARARRALALDALARLVPDPTVAITDVLSGPACARFGEGLRVVIATDLALRGCILPAAGPTGERFVVLDASGFCPREAGRGGGMLPIRPWIRIEGPGAIPRCLRSGREEVALAR